MHRILSPFALTPGAAALTAALIATMAAALTSTTALAQGALPQQDNEWFTGAQSALEERLSRQQNTNRAKNVILMISDGNGVGTNYATRLFQGQEQGNFGDEHVLPQESFPHLALVKTYNVNAQTPDSAGTGTAMHSGVKTNAGMIGVNESVARGDCAQVEGNRVTPITRLMSDAGKSVGIVSTARLTHATPASAYAHSADRNFEDDAELPEGCEVPDIAVQLIGAMESGLIDVAMGGGRRHFLPEDVQDEEGDTGTRTDGRNLVEEAKALGASYVFDSDGFAAVDPSAGPVLGLFESSHMQYEFDRSGEPSLAEMVEASIGALEGNQEGFFLSVEAGRVDHANHAGNLHRTVTDGVAFAEAVAKARELTDPEETLIVVTADHEHAIAFAGYCGRGTPITGLCYGIDEAGLEHNGEPELADDGQPYTVVGYLNGAGSVIKKEEIPAALAMESDHSEGSEVDDGAVADASGADSSAASDAMESAADRAAADLLARLDTTTEVDEESGDSASYRWIGSRGALDQEEATDPDYLQQALVPKSSETHSGEDVAVYAIGPFAHLFDGTVEQNYVFHVMHHAVFGADE